MSFWLKFGLLQFWDIGGNPCHYWRWSIELKRLKRIICLNNPVKYIDPTGHWFSSSGYSPNVSPSSSERHDYQEGRHDTKKSAGEISGGYHSNNDGDQRGKGETHHSEWRGEKFVEVTTKKEEALWGLTTRTHTTVSGFNMGTMKTWDSHLYGSDANAFMNVVHGITPGAIDGFTRAAKVAVLTKAFVVTKSFVAVKGWAYAATQPTIMWYGSGSYYAQKLVLDAAKVQTPTGFLTKMGAKAVNWAISPPPWEE